MFGFAHIGVIEALEANGIQPNLISGSSAGAIIGLLYASGGSLLLDKFVQELESSGLLSGRRWFQAPTPNRYFAKVGSFLDSLVTQKDLKTLNLPFYPVATDLATGDAHVFDDGDPITAVLASATYPVALSAYRRDNNSYLDGGLTRYLPADTLLEKGADIVIGSSIQVIHDLNGEKVKKLGKVKLAIRSIEIMQEQLSESHLEHCDYIIRPKFNPNDSLKVGLLNAIIDVGHTTAQEEIAKLKKSDWLFS